MAISYYDDAIVNKLQNWIPDNSKLRVLTPEDSKRLFEIKADENNDKPLNLPLISLSRSKDIELESAVKQVRSHAGLMIYRNNVVDTTAQLNIIPIKVTYQLDIYTKYQSEGDEYVRNFLFKLINNPKIIIEIPYNDLDVKHTANLRVLNTVSDTSDIAERHFPGQFTRWSIQLELQDGFLFSIPYRKNWKLIEPKIEVSEKITDPGELEIVSQTEISKN